MKTILAIAAALFVSGCFTGVEGQAETVASAAAISARAPKPGAIHASAIAGSCSGSSTSFASFGEVHIVAPNAPAETTFVVKLTDPSGSTELGRHPLRPYYGGECAALVDLFGQLVPTTNPGGNYKVSVCGDPAQPSTCSSQTFKVRDSRDPGPQILAFDADPDALIRGTPTNLTWRTARTERVEVTGVTGLHSVARTAAPFIDIGTSPTKLRVPFDRCDTPYSDEGCSRVSFPAGFAFPYAGDLRTEARIYMNGVVSFDLDRTGPSFCRVSLQDCTVPSTINNYIHLAPYWEDLAPGAVGEILYDVGSDAKGRYLVVQWSHYSFPGYAISEADMNFEVIMWEDGDFDFRYAGMWAVGDRAIGRQATIGFQDPTGTDGAMLLYATVTPELEHSGWEFRQGALTGDGAIVVPAGTRTYVLTAHGFDGQTRTASRNVTVHPPVKLEAAISTAALDSGERFDITWTANDAHAVTISDETGDVVHTAGPAELSGGRLTLTAGAPGHKIYTVRAIGALDMEMSVDLLVTFRAAFGLDAFSVDDEEVDVGGSTILRWATHGSESFVLTANGAPIDTSAMDPAGGTLVVTPSYTTDYRLAVSRLDGRVFTKAVRVRVVRVHLDPLTVSTSQIAAGGTVDVSWTASSPSGETIGVLVVPQDMEEVSSAFEDLSVNHAPLPQFATDRWATVDFPSGFSFPFIGEAARAVRISSIGFLSFDLGHQAWWYQPTAFPSNYYLAGLVHLAPFWEDLQRYDTGEIYAGLVSDAAGDRFIVQWKSLQYWTPTGAPGADLNFEVVLFPNGSFEFRYGTMSSPNDPGRADGSFATIGYQDRTSTFGANLTAAEVVAGGLSNRSWRLSVDGASTGTATARVGPNGMLGVCALVIGDFECQTVKIHQLLPGSISVTELMLDPSGGPDAQWFEVRNLAAHAIDLDGLEIRVGAVSRVIGSGSPILLQPGEYATFAAGPSPGFTPTWVYGSGMTLDPSEGDLSVSLGGSALTQVRWDSTWPIVPGSSLELDGGLQTMWRVADPLIDPSDWCESGAVSGSGDRGTPGASGPGCINVYDVDYHSSMPFIDIAATGTPVPNGGNNDVELLGGVPFSFPFFGDDLTGAPLWYSSDVFIAFGWYGPGWADWEAGSIMPFAWGGLLSGPGSSVVTDLREVAGKQTWIVQWTDWTHYDDPGSSITLQVQLWEGGDIVIAYSDIVGGDAIHGAGNYLPIGLVAVDWADQMMYTPEVDTSPPYLHAGQSIYFHYR